MKRSLLITASLLLVLPSASSSFAQTNNFPSASSTLAQEPPNLQEKFNEAAQINQEGWALLQQSDYPGGLKKFQQALAIFKQYNATGGEADTLNNIGTAYIYLRQQDQALKSFEKSLALYKSFGDRPNQGYTLDNIGNAYESFYQYPKAIEFYQQALAIYKELKFDKEFGSQGTYTTLLQSIGGTYLKMGQPQKSLEFYQQMLPIYDRGITKAQVLNNIGVVYVNAGNYAEALKSYQEAWNIATTVGNCYSKEPGAKICYYGDEAAILNNLGAAYFNLGQYQKALELAERATTIYRQFNPEEQQEPSANNIKLLYSALGENAQNLGYFKIGFNSRANVGDAYGKELFKKGDRALNLNNIAKIYEGLEKYEPALKLYQQALKIYQESNYKIGQAATIANISQIYFRLGNQAQAKSFSQQALKIYQEVGDRAGEGTALNNLGRSADQQGNYEEAMQLYQQALVIHKEVGDRFSEGTTLRNIGGILEKQKQLELAIVFNKQSVNVAESIRKDLQPVPVAIQKTYLETVAERYRALANLLLQQNRPGEAQQVLDLLKVQEIADYVSEERGISIAESSSPSPSPKAPNTKIETTSRSVTNLGQEDRIAQEYSSLENQAIALGKELASLRKIPPDSRSAEQKQRIIELDKIQQQLVAQFNAFTKKPEIIALVQQLNKTAQQQSLSLSALNSLRDNLKRLNQNAVVLYPLVLEDRIELVLVSADAPPISRSVPVKKAELWEAIANFRKALQTPSTNAKKPAQKLYEWLIKPIENDLKQAGAQTILYAPDGRLRYIPLAALYDGDRWLVERFRVNNITAQSLTNLNATPLPVPQILAAAFTQGQYDIQVGTRQFSFAGLPFAGKEIDNLAKVVPNTKKLVDNAFGRDSTVPQMDDYTIVHLATHAAFVTGKPEDSFILFGNGDRASLRDVGNWSFQHVDLMVLSACETGVGGELEDGEEILGFGYLMQQAGVRAAIASLWSVSDGGTQALMSSFYAALQGNNITKAEALRQAQIALITGNYQALGKQRGDIVVEGIQDNVPTNVQQRLNHPYYWSPFILIGNGL